MKLMGIDYGSKRVGIALSDDGGTLACPRTVLPSDSRRVSAIAELVASQNIEGIVIGESKNFSGGENPIMEDIRQLKTELEAVLSIPLYFEPEFLTSKEAEHIQGKNDMHDASAAALILNSFIARKHH